MRLGTKHQNERTVSSADFTGGLNNSAVASMIGENQLAEAVNMELDRVTGALRTCCGTAMIYKAPPKLAIESLMYDRANNVYLFTSMQGVYKSRLIDMHGDVPQDHEKIGALTGDVTPIHTAWKDGLLIASGGKLQYWNGSKLTKFNESPNQCKGVFVMDGRAIVWWLDELRLSAVGDAASWKEDNNDDSASKFVQIGYQDGGEIVGVTSLSKDIVVIKSNGRMYRLSGAYPNWTVSEISRNIDCLNRLSFCAVAGGVFVLGRDSLQFVQTTNDYGEMQPTNIANKVVGLFYGLDLEKTRLIFVSPLNQLWIVGILDRVIIYDLTYNAFFEREFCSPITDICVSKNTVLLARGDKVTRLMDGIFKDAAYSDDESSYRWRFRARDMVSYNEFLLKRMRVSYVPFLDAFESARVVVGKVAVPLHGRKIYVPTIYGDDTPMYNDQRYIFPALMQFDSTRQIYRNMIIETKAEGAGSAFMLSSIEFSIAEV